LESIPPALQQLRIDLNLVILWGGLNMRNPHGVFAAIVIVALPLFTAWGNATALLVVSAILLVAGFVVFRADTFRRNLLAVVIGSALAAAIAIVIR
jgi:hypothetical protein